MQKKLRPLVANEGQMNVYFKLWIRDIIQYSSTGFLRKGFQILNV